MGKSTSEVQGTEGWLPSLDVCLIFSPEKTSIFDF